MPSHVTFHAKRQVDEGLPAAQPFGQGSKRLSEFLGATGKSLRPFAGDVHHRLDECQVPGDAGRVRVEVAAMTAASETVSRE